jgi:hypothetical protein
LFSSFLQNKYFGGSVALQSGLSSLKTPLCYRQNQFVLSSIMQVGPSLLVFVSNFLPC